MLAYLELVELENGDIALRRSEGGEPMVVIHFSAESKQYLGGASVEVARAMLQAGIEAAAELNEQASEEDISVDTDAEGGSPTIH